SPAPHNAYIFYATNYDYSCSALVNVFFDKLASATQGRVFIIRAEPPQNKLKNPMAHYKNVLLKLVPFDLGVRDVSNTTATAPRWTAWGETGKQKVDRMIIMDSDQLILRNLDHLFDLPPVEIAAPRNYWGGDHKNEAPLGSTTTLMVARPSKSLWKRMQDAMETLREGEYDMDLVQRVFGNEIMTLPGRYCTLNSHWEVNDQPFWYHHEADERVHLDEQLEWEKAVVHFTALGKPWSFTVGDVRYKRPEAHWVFAEMFGEWRDAARALCPGWVNIH
ncbi:nucleotide-diphospho-sugar transferase, partial [Terfezia claveryi]